MADKEDGLTVGATVTLISMTILGAVLIFMGGWKTVVGGLMLLLAYGLFNARDMPEVTNSNVGGNPRNARGQFKKTVDQTKYPVVFLDLETTGLEAPPADEVVQIGIVDEDGTTLLDSYVQPTTRKRWPKAEAIHGVSPKMVKGAPTMEDLMPPIREMIAGKRLVIYNAKFDTKFIQDILDAPQCVSCCMLRYGEYDGTWDDRFNHYKWHKLEVAAKKVKHRWQGKAHSALADAQATRSVWLWLDSKGAEIV